VIYGWYTYFSPNVRYRVHNSPKLDLALKTNHNGPTCIWKLVYGSVISE